MTNPKSRSFISRGLTAFAMAFALLVAGIAGGSDPASAAVVNRIDVEGNQRVDDATVRAYILIQPGRSFGAQEVDESLKALFATGLFADASIDQRGSVLVVVVEENPIINTVAFEGNKKFKDDQLGAVVQSQPRGVFTPALAQGDVQRVLELYRRSGKFQASVDPEVIQLSNNRVNLVFVVNEGPTTNVSSITFIGNQAFGDGRLKNVVATREAGLLGFLRTTDTYDPDRMTSDEDKLRRYYLNRGYADMQVVSSVADLDRERNSFFITFTIDEGQRYRFGAVGVDSSIPGIDSARLERLVTTREGDVFSSGEVDKSLEAITIELAGSGYAFAQVRTRLDRDPATQTIGVIYVVDEGPRAYIERIEIRGNDRTRDYVIRREFDVSEGDAFNRVLIDRAERRLRGSGYFSDVRVSTEQGASPDRVIVVVEVTEQPTGEFSFGAGYSTSDGIIGDVSLTEKNFLGRGYVLRASAGGGSDSRNYEFGFTDPYFLGRRISAGFNVFRREQSSTDSRPYESESTGANFAFGLPVTENFSVILGYQIENRNIAVEDEDDDDDGVSAYGDRCDYDLDNTEENGYPWRNNVSRAICQAEGETLISSVSYSLVYDTLDNRRDPHDGLYAKFTQEFAGVGGDVSYLRTTATASYYKELLPDRDVVGFVKVQGGHIMGVGEDLLIIDHFFKGGETVRGFESSGFGPRDGSNGNALGGKTFAAATAEVQFPIPLLPRELGFKGAVFADAGTLFNTDSGNADGFDEEDILDDAAIRSSVGGSILWDSPLGPLRADYAYVLSSEEYDEKQAFRIGGGSRF